MLIKIQEGRFSNAYQIIENARHVRYKALPEAFWSQVAFEEIFKAPVQGPGDLLLNTHEDIMVGKQFPERAACLSLNNVSFVIDGQFQSIWFDGEAFICTDEGKTVQRLHRAGFTMKETTDDGHTVLLPEGINPLVKAA
ncbi:hypothetical protein GGE65_007281 [Skermanella aerolata]|uniref:hypothetical protein n=1 Tax=Skermanella aerolata TaxID=393310 RepID=UPI003D1E54D1